MADKNKTLIKNLDKILFGVATLLLVGSGAVLALNMQKPAINVEAETAVPPQQAEVVDSVELEKALDELGYEAVSQPTVQHPTLVSETRVPSVNEKKEYYLIRTNATVCPFTGEAQPDLTKIDSDKDGIPDREEQGLGLNPRVDDAAGDKDGDKFTNLEEYELGTDLNDATSHPDYATKLRVYKTRRLPMNFEFIGSTTIDGEKVFTLSFGGGKTFFKRIGEEAEGWSLTNYTEKKGAIGEKDRSELTLQKGEAEVVLVRGVKGGQELYQHLLVYLIDPSVKMVVKKNATFTLEGVSYKVVNMIRDESKVVNQSTGEEIFIRMPTRKETYIITGDEPPEEEEF